MMSRQDDVVKSCDRAWQRARHFSHWSCLAVMKQIQSESKVILLLFLATVSRAKGACPTLPVVTRRRRCGQMRGRRPEADRRFTFHGSWERAENDADGRRSFAAVERSMSDRLHRHVPIF